MPSPSPRKSHLNTDESKFCHVADEWLLTYAQLSSQGLSGSPMASSAAMAVELYLKAYHVFLCKDSSKTTSFSHDLFELAKEINASDPCCPPVLKFSENIYKLPLEELDGGGCLPKGYSKLSKPEKMELKRRPEIYLILKHSAELKYGISSALKCGNKAISSSWTPLHPDYAEIAVGVGKQIHFPKKIEDDYFYRALPSPTLSEKARVYIKDVYDRTHAYGQHC
jgi:hypothetical protein